MPRIVADEECELCLGTGWQTHPPLVLGQNEDGTDILTEPKISMCRCALVDEQDPDEVDDEDYDDENEDENEDERLYPPLSGNALVPAR